MLEDCVTSRNDNEPHTATQKCLRLNVKRKYEIECRLLLGIIYSYVEDQKRTYKIGHNLFKDSEIPYFLLYFSNVLQLL